MTNVGVNQASAAFETDYNGIQKPGPARDAMILAMREVIVLSQKDGVFLTEDDLRHWLEILDTLSPTGKPSMRQDLEARRLTEVELFAGTVLQMGQKHKIKTPVNGWLFEKIRAAENSFNQVKETKQ
jgi:2-dehydropantoate 2-reductase